MTGGLVFTRKNEVRDVAEVCRCRACPYTHGGTELLFLIHSHCRRSPPGREWKRLLGLRTMGIYRHPNFQLSWQRATAPRRWSQPPLNSWLKRREGYSEQIRQTEQGTSTPLVFTTYAKSLLNPGLSQQRENDDKKPGGGVVSAGPFAAGLATTQPRGKEDKVDLLDWR